MRVIGIIQARMGSTRLPGKMMLPLNCTHAIQHVIRRVEAAESVDSTVVATSDKQRDDILERYAHDEDVSVYRGDEDDVLGRMYQTAKQHDADVVVRITGDDVLVSPRIIDALVEVAADAEYATNTDRVPELDRDTFPVGLDVEAFDIDSFATVQTKSSTPQQREHVTPYYYENPDEFTIKGIEWDDVFSFAPPMSFDDVWLGLDTPKDYELLRKVYEGVTYDEILDIRDALDFIHRNGLTEVNSRAE